MVSAKGTELSYSSFIFGVGAVTILLYIAMKVFGGVNTYFIALHIFLTAILMYLLLKINVGSKIKISSLTPFALLIIPVALVFAAERFYYGSVALAIVIGLVSGYIATKFLDSGSGDDDIDFKKWFIIPIFILALVVRAYVFATPKVPLGYDTPAYLILALKASKMELWELLRIGLGFSGDAYVDNWNFSMLWLGLTAKLISWLGLDLLAIPRFFIPAISAACVVPVFLLVRELSDSNSAFYSALIFSILPSELLFCDLYKEILGEFFLILSLYLFVRFSSKKNATNLFLFLASAFLLWKVAVTAFSKFAMFFAALLPIFAFYGKINSRIPIFVALLTPVILVLGHFFPIVGFPLHPVRPMVDNPYTRFSFPVILLTDSTAFMLALSGLFVFLSSSGKFKRAYAVGAAIFLAIAVYSGILSGVMGYRIFPSSFFLNTFRVSLYLSIPLSILAGVFLSEMRLKRILVLALFALLACDLVLAVNSETTIHSPARFYSYISEEDYETLSKLDYSACSRVVLVGNFSWSPDTKNYSAGNWIKYIVFSKTGELPEVHEEVPDVSDALVIVYHNDKIYVKRC